MPWSALPDHLNIYKNPDAWKGTDDDVWYMRWRIKIKGWFAYGYRAPQWWAQWRVSPRCCFKIGGKGPWRWETFEGLLGHIYLSRIQYWKRWHFQIQWPLAVAGHFYFHKRDVMPDISEDGNVANNKLLYFYFGCMYDGDGVYWFPAAFIGRVWK
jgi:hypothetical protein